MKKIGLLKAFSLCSSYKKMDISLRNRQREKRLSELISWVRENSPYYSKLYKDLSDHISFDGLPCVNKQELMAHWNEWITDGTVTLDKIEGFMKNSDNIGRKYNKKYMILTTSGSTGNPLVMLCDDTTNHVMAAVSATRSYARKEDLKAFLKRGGKSIGIFADSGFYLSNSSIRSRLLKMPWKRRQMAISSALQPIDTIVEQLNAFRPAMLGGYPTNLELLIDEQKEGYIFLR